MTANIGPDWIMIMGTPVLKKKFYAIIAFLLLVFIGSIVGGVMFYKDLVEQSKVEGGSAETSINKIVVKDDEMAVTDAAKPFMDPLTALLDHHAHKTYFKDLASLIVTGVYKSGDVSVELSMMSREPDRFNQTLEFEDRRITVGLVDGELWVKQTHTLLDEQDETLSTLNRTLMVMECAIPFLAWQYTDNVYRENLERVADEQWGDVAVGVIVNTAFEDMIIYHYIGIESGRELKRLSTVKANGREQVIEVAFSDPYPDLQYLFPAGYSIAIDGDLYCTAEFKQFDFNKGLASFLFEKR